MGLIKWVDCKTNSYHVVHIYLNIDQNMIV